VSDPVDDLRAAARRALEQMGQASDTDGVVQRIVVDVSVDGRTEMVTLSLRDGEIAWSTSDGDKRGPHVIEALRLLAAGASGAGLSILPKGVRTSPGELASELRPSLLAEEDKSRKSDPADKSRAEVLAGLLEDLVTAIARVGVREARESATVREALERIAEATGQPMPVGVSRILGRLRRSLSRLHVDRVARILEGASCLAEDLREASPSPRARQRIVSFLGPEPGSSDIVRVSDRTLVEVGREYLTGMERAYVDRRYLLCVDSGEVFKEERGRGAPSGSVGPTPRTLTVGLGEVAEGTTPRAIRLLQYAVSNQVTADVSNRIDEAVKTNFGEIIESYRQNLDRYPGLAEPFVVVAPQKLEHDPGTHILDREGTPLPLSKADGLGRTQALRALLTAGRRVDWISGRLVDSEGSPILVPCGVGYREDGVRRIRRLS
jgi:hypothetical protein